ncbi:MAG: TVP38/TMEM64 family protein [Candidatus Binataceae bacterium]|nr:TVP38/TMEM64 family protein [Candidatus Binataceae bacterium]
MAVAAPVGSSPRKPEDRFFSAANLLRIGMLFVLVGATVYLLLAHSEWFDNPKQVKVEILACGIWGPIVFILLYAVGPSLLVPGAVMTVTGGLAFGALWGAVYSLVGANLGALIAFGAGRFLGGGFVRRTVSRRFHHLMDSIARRGFQIIFYLRMVPVIPYNALNLLAGASPIRFEDYFWATIFGMIPGTIVFAFLGNALWHPGSRQFFLALGFMVLCLAAGEGYRRWSELKMD